MHMATMYAQLPSLSCDDWMTCALKLKAVSHGPAAASCRASRPFPDMCDLFVLCVRNYLSVLLLKLTAILHLISLGVAGMMSHSFIHPSIHSIFHSLIHSSLCRPGRMTGLPSTFSGGPTSCGRTASPARS